MEIADLHSWDLTPKEAIALQQQLRHRVSHDLPSGAGFRLVAGVDVSCTRFGKTLYAGIVVCDAKDWSIVEQVGVVVPTTFPYVPGLLTFREGPGLIEAFRRLATLPDVVLVDGQGFAHPRRLGIASHLGLWLGIPTIGCAKSRLVGTHAEPGRNRGSSRVLKHQEELIGRVLRSQTNVRPLYVSVGHQIDLPTAVKVVLKSATRYRVPQPIRHAHDFVNRLRIGNSCQNGSL